MGIISNIRERLMRRRPVRVMFQDASFVYDGQPHVPAYNVEGLPNGLSLQPIEARSWVDVTPGPVLVPSPGWRILNSRGRDVSRRFLIEEMPAFVEITPASLEIRSGSSSKTWDGNPLFCADIAVDGLIEGESLSVRAVGGLSEPGSAANEIEVDWTASSAKRGNYQLLLLPGSLRIEPGVLSGVDTVAVWAVYDGEPHGFEVHAPTGSRIVFSDSAHYRDAGSYESGFTVTMPHHVPFYGAARLTILPRRLKLTGGSASKVWDGLPLACPSVEVDGLAAGEQLSAHAVGEITDEGTMENSVVVDWDASTAQKANYELEITPGNLEVELADLDMPSALSAEVVYDGRPHAPAIEVPDGAKLEFDGPAEFAQVGRYQVAFTVRAPHHKLIGGVCDLSIVDYPGPLSVITEGGAFVYDGQEHRATVRVGELPSGYILKAAESRAVVRNVADGPVPATCDVLRIEDAFGRDATGQLNVVYCDSSISVEPCPVSLRTFDARKTFDGTPLKCTQVRVSGLVEGQTATAVVFGEQTQVGQSVNEARLVFDGTARQDNYRVVRSFGKLTVEEAPEPAAPVLTPDACEPAPAPTPMPVPLPEVSRPNDRVSSLPPATPVIKQVEPVVEWRKPTVRFSGSSVDRAVSKTRRHHTKTPVEERPDLEEMGLGRGFAPFSQSGTCMPIGDPDLLQAIRVCEEKSRTAIEEICEQYADALLFQAFGVLGPDLSEVCSTVKRVFDYSFFRADKRRALSYIHDNCQNAFLVFVACLAREYSNADGIWSEMFKAIDVGNQSNQTAFKRMFIAYLYQRHLPVFESNEAAHYYARTAYLHGGFSRDVWMALWRDALVEMAKGKALPPEASGDLVFERVMDLLPENDARHRRIKELLRMAPAQATSVLFEMAWKVVVQAVAAGSKPALITNYGLSEIAMAALVEVLGGRHCDFANRAQRGIVFLNKMRLILDALGSVRIVWHDSELPSSMAGSRLDVFVNGVLAKACDISKMTTHARLSGGSVEVAPCTRYDVELRLMAPTPQGELAEVSSLFQCFQNTKPACYEFVRTSSGECRFREPDERISRTRRITYLVPGSMRVVGVRGMELLNVMECTGAWEAMRAYEFTVEPGAAGNIVDESSGEILSAWHEDFRVRVDKSKMIGRAGDVDLYGHVMGVGQTDVALPSIKIEAPEGTSPDDVEVRFVRDGREGLLDATWTLDDEGRPLELKLNFPQAEQGKGIARLCVIEARQRTTGSMLLRYRFAIAPIQGFRIVDCKVKEWQLYGVYGFTATESLEVVQIEGSIEHCSDVLEQGEDAFVEALLEAQTAHVRLSIPAGDVLEAELLLAGVKVGIDLKLWSEAQEEPLNLATLQKYSAWQTAMCLTTRAARKGLFVQVCLGREVLMRKMLDKATEATVNLFDSKALLMPPAGKVYESCPLRLLIGLGFELKDEGYQRAAVHFDLLPCAKGLGFKSCKVRLGRDGRRELLCFDADTKSSKLACDLHVKYTDGNGRYPKVYETVIVRAGERNVALSPEIRELYRKRGKPLFATITTVSLFGDPDPDNEITVSLHPRKDRR